MATARTNTKSQTPADELLSFAQESAKHAKTWMDLHNAVYGLGGKFGELFPDQKSRTVFAKSSQFHEIGHMIRALNKDESVEMTIPSGKFILRVPESLHAALLAEAKAEGVSLNQLCMAKLVASLQSTLRS